MKASEFTLKLQQMGIAVLAGVPDSALKPFCDYINGKGNGMFTHYVPANEGAAVGIAIGSYLATGKPACVYMQNSGIGNAVNPVTSLANRAVYGIPMLMVIGFRGEPGKKDEPQHKFMGSITEDILRVLEIEYALLGDDTECEEVEGIFQKAEKALKERKQFALVMKRGFFEEEPAREYTNSYSIVREEAVREILMSAKKEDIVISTTGKISREVYEQCNDVMGHHNQAFLTVGGMGHASMIALGMAEEVEKRVYCLDGDGALLMHMGSLAFIGKRRPDNLVHICLNNEAHESVGGMPTGSAGLEYAKTAQDCGYERVYSVRDMQKLRDVLKAVQQEKKLTFLEVKVSMEAREDLGRPKETAEENKNCFMKYHGVKV